MKTICKYDRKLSIGENAKWTDMKNPIEYITMGNIKSLLLIRYLSEILWFIWNATAKINAMVKNKSLTEKLYITLR